MQSSPEPDYVDNNRPISSITIKYNVPNLRVQIDDSRTLKEFISNGEILAFISNWVLVLCSVSSRVRGPLLTQIMSMHHLLLLIFLPKSLEHSLTTTC